MNFDIANALKVARLCMTIGSELQHMFRCVVIMPSLLYSRYNLSDSKIVKKTNAKNIQQKVYVGGH